MPRLSRTMTTLAALTLVLALAGPAAAGGWANFIPLNGSELGVGERFESARDAVLFRSAEAAARARSGVDPYYAYLIPEMDWEVVEEAMSDYPPRDWWVQPSTAFRAGTVEVWGGSANDAAIRVHYDVPDVTPGPYALMLCSEGCAEPLADIIPSAVTLTADPLTARTARKLGQLRTRVVALRNRANHFEKQIRELRAGGREAQPTIEARMARAESQAARVDAQAERVRELERRIEELEGAAPALAWLVVGAAGAALLLLLPRRRRPRGRPPEPPVEMELVEPPRELEPDRTAVPAA